MTFVSNLSNTSQIVTGFVTSIFNFSSQKIAAFTTTIFSYISFIFSLLNFSSTPKLISSHNISYINQTISNIDDIIFVHEHGDGSAGCCGLADLRRYAASGNYNAIRNSHYDWWMFPIDQTSSSKGSRFVLSRQECKTLSENKEFMQNYIEGIRIVLAAWGWDLDNSADISSPTQYWDNYSIRRSKMERSLNLFIKNASGHQKKQLQQVYRSFKAFMTQNQ